MDEKKIKSEQVWREMEAKSKKRKLKYAVGLLIVLLLFGMYALYKGFPPKSELLMRLSSHEKVIDLTASSDTFPDSEIELYFAVYHSDSELIQLCFIAPKDISWKDLSSVQTQAEYRIDGIKVERTSSFRNNTWLRSHINILIEDVEDFTELQFTYHGKTITIRE